jgi:hypothetical protein
VELSPFTVNTSQDVGYLAENTLAGSRLNARLRDTAGSVSVFTKEFLDDLAITDIAGLLDYTVNSEVDTNAMAGGLGAEPVDHRRESLEPHAHSRTRGQPGHGLFHEHHERRPVPRRALRRHTWTEQHPVRHRSSLWAAQPIIEGGRHARQQREPRYGFGSWERSRIELDANRVLIKDKLAVSIAALDPGERRMAAVRLSGQGTDFRRGHVSAAPHPHLPGHGRDRSRRERRHEDPAALGGNARLVRQSRGSRRQRRHRRSHHGRPDVALRRAGHHGAQRHRGGQNRRAVFIENNGAIFDAIGTYLTGQLQQRRGARARWHTGRRPARPS